jgi:probable phosphoglycerate mutase
MTTRVMLVRHGATILNADDRFAGASDVPLGDDGRMQVQHLAERLASDSLAAIYASPLRRALETASIIAKTHELQVQLLDGLREIDHGRWEGLRRDEAAARYPEEYAAWERDPFTFAPTGGEPGQQVLERALRAFQQIVNSHPGGRVLVVSHKATIRLIIAHVLGVDPRGYRDRLDQQPACLNLIDMYPDGTGRLVLMNDVSHYTWTLRHSLAAGT